MALQSRTDLEEERRLFYVAVTRAMHSCTISYASSRFLWGQAISCEPSRFLDEIDPSYLSFNTVKQPMGKGSFGNKFQTARTGGLNKNLGASPPGNLRSLKDVKRAQASNNESNASNTEIKVGFNVEHERFGKGKVTHMEGSGADQKATIFFPHHGSKTILLRFANLEVLE